MKNARCCLLLLLVGLIAGCGRPMPPSARHGLSIISLTPGITEILFALGLEKNMVGITTCCNYPAGTKRIERVATFSGQANLERILTLKPDLVFSTGLEQASLVEKLRKLVNFLLSKQINGLYICGSSGEGLLMSVAERKLVAEVVKGEVKEKMVCKSDTNRNRQEYYVV